MVEKFAYFQRGYNPRFWSNIPDFIRTQFSVKETLVLSFDDFVISKGGFLDDKTVILP